VNIYRTEQKTAESYMEIVVFVTDLSYLVV